MFIVFVVAVAVIVYVYGVYPAMLIAWSLIRGNRVRKSEIDPSVSLIISVYNEEDIIEEKVKNSLALDYSREKLEIIVASESNDGTNPRVRPSSTCGPRWISWPVTFRAPTAWHFERSSAPGSAGWCPSAHPLHWSPTAARPSTRQPCAN